MCLVSCSGNSTTFALNMVRALLMSPMKEETTKLMWKLLARTTMWKKLHTLPWDTEVWTKTSKC